MATSKHTILAMFVFSLSANFSLNVSVAEEGTNPFGAAYEKRNNPFVKCVDMQTVKNIDACLDKVGRIEWRPYKSPDDCALIRDILNRADNSGSKLSWKLLFMNERCRNYGELFYKR